ncbi:hypothetical protein ABZ714_11955 [Streptomyces sp. NPDC006798]|uniref:hypothetical protein n=1 Tax=Streptomyces sp. NPDC006798 TaxID=3155462 RepID=UPI0033F5F12C
MSEQFFHTHQALQASELYRAELIRRAEQHRLARRARRAAQRAATAGEGRVTPADRYVPAA